MHGSIAVIFLSLCIVYDRLGVKHSVLVWILNRGACSITMLAKDAKLALAGLAWRWALMIFAGVCGRICCFSLYFAYLSDSLNCWSNSWLPVRLDCRLTALTKDWVAWMYLPKCSLSHPLL